MAQQAVSSLVVSFVFLPLFLVSLPTLFVVYEALRPRLLSRSRAHLARAPRRAFLIGLVNWVFFFGLAALLGSTNAGILALIAVLLLLGLLFLAVAGFATLAGVVGTRVLALWERPASSGGQVFAGGLALEALLFVPVVGWLMLIVTGLTSCGAVIMALWQRGSDQEQGEDAAAPAGD